MIRYLDSDPFEKESKVEKQSEEEQQLEIIKKKISILENQSEIKEGLKLQLADMNIELFSSKHDVFKLKTIAMDIHKHFTTKSNGFKSYLG